MVVILEGSGRNNSFMIYCYEQARQGPCIDRSLRYNLTILGDDRLERVLLVDIVGYNHHTDGLVF